MFKKIPYKESFITDWFENYNPSSYENWSGFEGHKLDKDFFINNSSVVAMLNNISLIKNIALLKMQPYQVYPYHVDNYKKCKVNMLLSHDHESFTRFKKIDKIVPYEKNYFYILDTTQEHMVENTNNDRFLFTIMFDNDLDYTELCSRIDRYV